MNNGICRLFKIVLVVLLSAAVCLAAEPFPQDQQPAQAEPSRPVDDRQQAPPADSTSGSSANTPAAELPDAPSSASPVQQKQNDSPTQTQKPAPVPSGAAGAKAAPAKGAPASRPVGSAIAPAKQRERSPRAAHRGPRGRHRWESSRQLTLPDAISRWLDRKTTKHRSSLSLVSTERVRPRRSLTFPFIC